MGSHLKMYSSLNSLFPKKLLILKLDKQEHVKCFDSDDIHSLGWMTEVL